MVSRKEVKVGILNLGFGNIQSLRSLLDRLGYEFVDITSHSLLSDEITHLIIPGAGDYACASEMLLNTGMFENIKNFVNSKKPVLGVCLGMQIMTDVGFESTKSIGLGLFEGETLKMNIVNQSYRLPHVGWNTVHFRRDHAILDGVKNDRDFYFTHSYAVSLKNDFHILAETEYGVVFPSIIAQDNIVGTQFHPEKSLKKGVRMIDNFCQWDGIC